MSYILPQLPLGKQSEQRASLWRFTPCRSFLFKSLIPFTLSSSEIQLEIMIFKYEHSFTFHSLSGGWITCWEPLWERKKNDFGISDATMFYGSILHPDDASLFPQCKLCAYFSHDLFSLSCLHLIFQSIFKRQFRSLDGQKLKLTKTKLKYIFIQLHVWLCSARIRLIYEFWPSVARVRMQIIIHLWNAGTPLL